MIYTLTLNPALDKQYLVKQIDFNEVLRTNAEQADFGGKGFNVSRMLKALGSESVALGFVGGKTGEVLSDGLHYLGIDTDFVQVHEETRTNISIVPEDRSSYVKVNEPGPTISKNEINCLIDKIVSLAKKGDWWVLAGSIPRGVGADIYGQLIHLIQSQGAEVILDASGEPLMFGCKSNAFLVKPNNVEAEKLTGLSVRTFEEAITASKVIMQMGIQNVVVSMGRIGAVWVSTGKAWVVTSPEIEEHNPIGAGDSLVAGLVWGLSNKLPYSEILRWGVACGAAAASMDGTAMGDRTLVEDLFEKTKALQLV